MKLIHPKLYERINTIIVLLSLGLVGIFCFWLADFESQTTPTLIRVGVLPDESKAKVLRRYTPLLNHLAAETGLNFELITPNSYQELLQLFANGKLEMASFGGLTFVKAKVLYAATPLVMRDVDTRFTTVFMTKKSAQDISEFKGKKFSFGAQLSTSGHLMPRYFLQQEKAIIPEEFFAEVRYSGTHDKTAYWVRDGVVDLGAANSEIIKTMFKDGRLRSNDIHILWETPPFSDYVWAVPRQMDEATKTSIRDAFLSLEYDNEKHAQILQLMGTGGFLPAGNDDFLLLEQIINSTNLLGAKMQ